MLQCITIEYLYGSIACCATQFYIIDGRFAGCKELVSSKALCEGVVKAHGGTLIQNTRPETNFVIAPGAGMDLPIKVCTCTFAAVCVWAGMRSSRGLTYVPVCVSLRCEQAQNIIKAGKHTVAHPNWLAECVEAHTFVPSRATYVRCRGGARACATSS